MNQELALLEEARHLAQQLFGNESQKSVDFADRLLDICLRAQGKDFLIIHNSGGWGGTPMEHFIQWERSIVDGVSTTMERLGYTWLLIQHFRTGDGWGERIRDMKEQLKFFTSKAKMMAVELEFITRHVTSLKVILTGISQGAAFSNAVMQYSTELDQVYSIELGMFSVGRPRRVVTKRTLAIDDNGLMRDAAIDWNIPAITKAYFIGPFRWIKSRLEGKPVRFFDCVSVQGHEYGWEYPEVRRRITDFLTTEFGTNIKLEGGLS